MYTFKFSVNCDIINSKYAYSVASNFGTDSDFQLKLWEVNSQFESNRTDFFQQNSFENVQNSDHSVVALMC